MPSSDASSAAASERATMAPYVMIVQSVPRRAILAFPIGSASPFAPRSPCSFDQYRLFGSKKITGSGSAIDSRRRS